MPGLDARHAAFSAHLQGLTRAPHWYVGLSGGVDSCVLLHLLVQWRSARADAPALTALHVNHGMQADARHWQAHCISLCNKLQVPLETAAVDVEPGAHGPEAAARTARYRAFCQYLQAGDVLFLGHHLDDQVETFFLRLMRGAGLRGLTAMRPQRTLARGLLVRPLLSFTRDEIERYAGQQQLQGVVDASNADTRLDRNFLRRQVLPLLATRWPGYRQTVSRAAQHVQQAEADLAHFLPSPPVTYSAMGDPGIAVAELLDGPEGAPAAKLRAWLRRQGRQAPAMAALTEFLRQLRNGGRGAQPELRCLAYTLRSYQGVIYLLPDRAEAVPNRPVPLSAGGSRDITGVGRLSLLPATGAGLWLAPGDSLRVQWRRGGERCRPVGRGGGNSLKRLLQEHSVPPWWRHRIPLLYLGDELLAVGDLWLCHSSRWRQAPASGEQLWQLCWQADIGRRFD